MCDREVATSISFLKCIDGSLVNCGARLGVVHFLFVTKLKTKGHFIVE